MAIFAAAASGRIIAIDRPVMHQRTDSANSASRSGRTIRIASRNEISGVSHWRTAFAHERKDYRFYKLLEDTLKDFKYGYLIIEDNRTVCAIQPYFLIDQDLLAGLSGRVRKFIAGIRRLWPRFMYARTLMVGCAAGEGHLDGDESSQFANAELLARSLPQIASELNCAMIALKEFPARYRAPLQCLRHAGFT
ncbi:MAG: GNAT family N-acetyltransferase, partial [Pseudolabrys sp.]